jgi:hypothetical protein
MRRLLAATTVAAITVLLTLTPSGAVNSTDPAGDAIKPQGDIRGYVVRLDSATNRYVARISVKRGVNPVTTRSWRGTNTEIRVFWDVTPLPGDEFRTDIHTVGSPAVFTAETVNDSTGLPSGATCTATSATGAGPTVAYVAPNTYKVRVPADCLPLAQAVSARIEMTFDPRPAGGTDTDSAPDNGYVNLPS